MENKEKKLQNGTSKNEPEELEPATLDDVTGGTAGWIMSLALVPCPNCGGMGYRNEYCSRCGTRV